MQNPFDFSRDTQVGNGEVRIGRHFFPAENITELNLARLQNKVTFGDPSLDSDPLVSSYVMSSFTGGMGNEFLKEGAEEDTFWDATLETRYPEGPTLLALTEVFDGEGSADSAFPIGDYPAGPNSAFYASFDDDLHRWNANDQKFELVDELPANPVYRGVEFNGLLYIPLGASGFVTVDTDGNLDPSTDFNPIQFLVWDRKLCALTTDGYLRVLPRGGAWSSESEAYRLPSGNVPRRIVNFINQAGMPTLHIVTDSLVFAWDPDGEEMYETRLDYPKHPDQGRGAVNWRGDTMYVSVGTGVHGYNGTNITTMGPDGRYGLPAALRGTIVDLASEYNSLLAMVRGVASAEDQGPVEDALRINPVMYRDDTTYAVSDLPHVPVMSSILRWSNSQWHKVWESEGAAGIPTWMEVSNTSTEYRLWWGYGGRMYTQELPVMYQNPKQSLLSGATRFAPNGRLITGWFDADMTPFTKLASHLEVNLEDVTDTNDAGGKVTVYYEVDCHCPWTMIGSADTVGLTIMPFRITPRETGDPFSEGRPYRRIRFMIDYEQKRPEDPNSPEQVRAASFLSPLMSSMVFKFHKIPESQLSWSFTINLTTPGGYKDVGNKDLGDYLDSLLTSERFFEFGIGDKVYRVRMAQVSEGRQSGYDDRGNYQVNVVEAKMGSLREASTVVSWTDFRPTWMGGS